MTDATLDGAVPPPPSRSLVQRAPDMLVWGAVIALLLISFKPVEMHNFSKLFTNSQNMREFGAELLHPDFTQWKLFVGQMWLTVQIALWGTFMAIFMAVNSVVALAYYLSIVRTMFMDDVPDGDTSPVRVPLPLGAVVALTVVATLVLGTFPEIVAKLAEGSVFAFGGG